eukprot:TRINITY_DN23409_c1_g1_i1.p1 TRINITY_DN23409_c1_g1~~TRINITY_DN23409_c1_g1_i1.p1  ORF type:complete len:481 (+),score=147.33 TRINITY_DN23409_c1_g1_i1:139-1581(+)
MDSGSPRCRARRQSKSGFWLRRCSATRPPPPPLLLAAWLFLPRTVLGKQAASSLHAASHEDAGRRSVQVTGHNAFLMEGGGGRRARASDQMHHLAPVLEGGVSSGASVLQQEEAVEEAGVSSKARRDDEEERLKRESEVKAAFDEALRRGSPEAPAAAMESARLKELGDQARRAAEAAAANALLAASYARESRDAINSALRGDVGAQIAAEQQQDRHEDRQVESPQVTPHSLPNSIAEVHRSEGAVSGSELADQQSALQREQPRSSSAAVLPGPVHGGDERTLEASNQAAASVQEVTGDAPHYVVSVFTDGGDRHAARSISEGMEGSGGSRAGGGGAEQIMPTEPLAATANHVASGRVAQDKALEGSAAGADAKRTYQPPQAAAPGQPLPLWSRSEGEEAVEVEENPVQRRGRLTQADEATAKAYTSMTILLILVALIFVMMEDEYYYDDDLSEQLQEQRAREQHNRAYSRYSSTAAYVN